MAKQHATELAHPGAVGREGHDGERIASSESPSPTEALSSDAPSTGGADGEDATAVGSRVRRGGSRKVIRTFVRVLLAALVVLVLGAVAGPYVYIHFIEPDPPKRLTFETTTPSKSGTAPSAPAGVAGVWTVSAGSTVGYRVNELLFGQKNTAVGRTTAVTGNLTIANTSVRTAAFTVDVTMASDNSARDRSYGRIMQTATFPTATFTLTRLITLAKIPADLQQISAPATGKLTLHGVTRPVTFNLKARRNGSKIEVNGLIPIAFRNYRITNPSLPGIKVGDTGELEFLLVFSRS